jgi:sporulation protein YlmC with PRC-barrel domain
MEDLGAPVSPLVVRDGTPVYDRDGREVGVVERVMSDEATGIFEGLVIHGRPILAARHLYAAHDQIAELRERGVVLAVRGDELHELDARAGCRRHDDGSPETSLEAALRKAWDWLVGARP